MLKPPPVYQPCPAREVVQAKGVRVAPAPFAGQTARPQHAQSEMKSLAPPVKTHGAPPVYRPRNSRLPVQLAGWKNPPGFMDNKKEDPAVAFPALSAPKAPAKAAANAPAKSAWKPLPKAPAKMAIQLPTPMDQWLAKPVVEAKPIAPVDSLAGIKAKIESWGRDVHAGSKETLTEEEITTLTDWALAVPSKGGGNTAFFVERGEGTGDYEGKDQLKIISKNYAAIGGGKKPTYHITLKS